MQPVMDVRVYFARVLWSVFGGKGTKFPSSASVVLQFAARLFLTDLSLHVSSRPSVEARSRFATVRPRNAVKP
jgi:hypothetical protein